MVNGTQDADAAMGSAIGGRARVLIYSHDTFGLGHLRRSRAIANALVAERPEVSVVIVSGSPVIGSFEFGRGVDYIRVPGVTKRSEERRVGKECRSRWSPDH